MSESMAPSPEQLSTPKQMADQTGDTPNDPEKQNDTLITAALDDFEAAINLAVKTLEESPATLTEVSTNVDINTRQILYSEQFTPALFSRYVMLMRKAFEIRHKKDANKVSTATDVADYDQNIVDIIGRLQDCAPQNCNKPLLQKV